MNISIPILGILAPVVMGTVPVDGNQYKLHREADRILRTSIYQYNNRELYGAHDYSIYSDLHKMQRGDTVYIGKVAYSIARTVTIPKESMWLLRRRITALFTCINNDKDRLVVILEPQ